jgi:hypothetical protein
MYTLFIATKKINESNLIAVYNIRLIWIITIFLFISGTIQILKGLHAYSIHFHNCKAFVNKMVVFCWHVFHK